MNVKTETRKLRGPTKAADHVRTQAVEETATALVNEMAAKLNGRDAEFVVDVLRAVARRMAGWITARAGELRCVGILTGAIAHACPGFDGHSADGRAAAEALFRRAA